MDSRSPRYRVPDELRETLLDFTIAYLLERPQSLPTFGLNFFQKLLSAEENSQQQQRSSINGSNNQQQSNNEDGK